MDEIGKRPLFTAAGSDDESLEHGGHLGLTNVAVGCKEEYRDDPDSITMFGVESQRGQGGYNVASYSHSVLSEPARSNQQGAAGGQLERRTMSQGGAGGGMGKASTVEPGKSEWNATIQQGTNVNIGHVNSSATDVNLVRGMNAVNVGRVDDLEDEEELDYLYNLYSNRSSLEQDKKEEWIAPHSTFSSNGKHANDPYDYDSSVPSLSDPRTSSSTDHSLDPPHQPWLPQQQQQQYHQQHNREFDHFQQGSGLSSHRSSNSSEILMLQQQEFLRLTRLRSQPLEQDPLVVVAGNKQEHPSSEKFAPQNIVHTPQRYQQQQQQPAGTPFAESSRPPFNDPEKMPLYIRPEEVGSTGSRPSYSSAHLQSYLDTTGVGSGNNAVDSRGGLRNRATNVYNPNSPTFRRSGIQGEDEQGRWTGIPTASDDRVQQFDPDVHKSKCCIIL